MAYVDQQKKKAISLVLKESMKKYPNVKYSLSVRNRMTICCTIKSGSACLNPNNKSDYSVNTYHIDKFYSLEAAEILNTIKDALNLNNHNNSDIMTDYFDVGHYIDISIGTYDKPYVVT